MNDKTFPTILIILQVAAATAYLTSGDVRKVAYWIAEAVLTTAITY